MTALRAELFATRRRPGVWVVGSVWLGLTIVFGMAVPYIVYLAISGSEPAQGGDPEALLATLLPDQLVSTTLSLFPLFGSAIMLIMGAVLAGGEFRWGTWGTLLTQGPSRTSVVLAKLGALAVVLVGVAVATFVTVGAIGAVLAVVEDRAMAWPGPGRVAAGLGSAWLVSLAAASLGFALGMVFRGTGTALGVGLVWLLALESAVNGLSFLLDVAPVQKVLLGPNAGSLAVALGATPQEEGGTPGVVATSGPLAACLTLAGYVVVLAAVSVWLSRRRDQV